jgi:hypothetical protein
MSSHNISATGYLLIVLAGVVLDLLSHRRESRIPSRGTALRRVMHARSGRVGVLAGWAWLGLHFFSR